MWKAKWMDFTPLIDVFLILLFVILINSTLEKDQLSQAQDLESQTLHMEINQQAALIDALEASIEMQTSDMDPLIYDFLSEQVTIIEVSLKSSNNHLWINDTATDLYLMYNDQNTLSARVAQKNKVKQTITDAVQQMGQNSPLILFTLAEDGLVYRYAFLLVQESLSELTRELGTDRAFFILKPYE